MMYLPTITKRRRFYYFLKQKIHNFSSSKRKQYFAAAMLDFILIVIILISGAVPAKRMLKPLISPFVSSLNSAYFAASTKLTKESFAFVPGLARNKFEDIALDGLSNLSFFDVPLTEDGQINKDSRGYASFTSDETSELFDKARYKKVNIFMTISAWDENIIKKVLDEKEVQQKLADQAIEEIKSSGIDGITIDFEYPKDAGSEYQQKFTDFIAQVTDQIHKSLPHAQVAVAVPSNLSKNQSLYNEEALSKKSDKIFLIASDLIVPEVKNNNPSAPLYGYNENEYWSKLGNLVGSLSRIISSNKLVMERAWYGNGDNYPLYTPSSKAVEEDFKQASDIKLDSATIEKLVEGVPAKGREAAKKSIPLIAKALENEGILNSNVLAYALATVEHETDETFEPLEEIHGRFSARRLGYEGGMDFFGRGYLQVTHLRNYKIIGERIGMGEELVKHPELATKPEIAAKILAAFFKDNNVANLASQGSFIAARGPINPDVNARSVARLALKYEID